jgi:hypothetical protein
MITLRGPQAARPARTTPTTTHSERLTIFDLVADGLVACPLYWRRDGIAASYHAHATPGKYRRRTNNRCGHRLMAMGWSASKAR